MIACVWGSGRVLLSPGAGKHGFACRVAKELAGIDSSASVNLLQFPKSKTFSEQLLSLAGGLNSVEDAATLLRTVARNPHVQKTLAPLTNASSGVLTMPPLYRLP